MALDTQLTAIAEKFAARADTSNTCIALEQPRTGLSFRWRAQASQQQYFIASATKLYTTALIMQLRSEGAISLESTVAELLGAEAVRGLHVHRGIDAGDTITVRHLLSHTSGIADYFEQKQPNGRVLLRDILKADTGWSHDDALNLARGMKPKFAPSTPGKAFYSDTNFHLLGSIIEAVEGSSYGSVLERRIIDRLRLRDTYLFTSHTLNRYDSIAPMLNGRRQLHIPRAMASFGADGAVVSTAPECVVFLRAFLAGELFPAEYLDEMTATWNRIFHPFEYGLGIMRFALPRYLSPFSPAPALIGHGGASGSLLYYAPEHDLFIAGSVNQVRNRGLPYQFALKLVAAVTASRE